MRVTIPTEDKSFFAVQDIDVDRFLGHLANNDTINGESTPFDLCEVFYTWGLVIFRFHSPFGSVTRAMNIAVLDLTKELVVKDDGTIVDRYEKIAEELCKTALDTLQGRAMLRTEETQD